MVYKNNQYNRDTYDFLTQTSDCIYNLFEVITAKLFHSLKLKVFQN